MDQKVVIYAILMAIALAVPYGGSCTGVLLFTIIMEFPALSNAFADMIKKIEG